VIIIQANGIAVDATVIRFTPITNGVFVQFKVAGSEAPQPELDFALTGGLYDELLLNGPITINTLTPFVERHFNE
jgi:hypothetical protein